MQIFTQTAPLPETLKYSVLAIGNFDGMHKGHVALIQEALSFARKNNMPMGVLTFEPHPRQIFQPNESPFRITPPAVKRQKIEELGIDFLVELEFTRDLAQKSPDDFVKDILIEHIGVDHIFIGEDFHFGQNRTGSVETLRSHALNVTSIDILEDEHTQKYSASHVRSHLRRGLISEANQILGWEWEIQGHVIHGDKRGRELGYPTANVSLNDTLHPAFGVYATYVQIEGETHWHSAATNIGIRPMFETKNALVEAYLFNFNEDIYGKMLRIRPIQKLRDEARFNSLEDLVTQIEKDCQKIKTILSSPKHI